MERSQQAAASLGSQVRLLLVLVVLVGLVLSIAVRPSRGPNAPTPVELVVGIALPVTGLAAIAWRDRQAAVREDLRVFRRATRSNRGQDRLAGLRRHLVAEFDALADEWGATVREP